MAFILATNAHLFYLRSFIAVANVLNPFSTSVNHSSGVIKQFEYRPLLNLHFINVYPQ